MNLACQRVDCAAGTWRFRQCSPWGLLLTVVRACRENGSTSATTCHPRRSSSTSSEAGSSGYESDKDPDNTPRTSGPPTSHLQPAPNGVTTHPAAPKPHKSALRIDLKNVYGHSKEDVLLPSSAPTGGVHQNGGAAKRERRKEGDVAGASDPEASTSQRYVLLTWIELFSVSVMAAVPHYAPHCL